MGQGLVKLVFQPPQSQYYELVSRSGRYFSNDPSLAMLWLTTELNDEIPAFFIKNERAHFTLLFSHGNAEDLGLISGYFRDVSEKLQVNIFAYEYSGYGISKGSISSEPAVYADIVAAFRYLRDQMNIPWNRIVPYGRSIGTAPSIHLASLTPVRGMVLQSPMTSIYRIPFRFRFTLPGDLFPNIDKIGAVCCPVFLIHGTRDEIVPVTHGQDLYKICKRKGTAYDGCIVDGGDHNNLETEAAEEFDTRFTRFLDYLRLNDISDMLHRQEAASAIPGA